MAIRLSKAFGSSLEVWLGFQLNGDLPYVAQRAASLKIARLDPRDISLAA
jgi:plasmid maintenance system antidote protein VapI